MAGTEYFGQTAVQPRDLIPIVVPLQMTVSSPLMDQKLIQVFHVKISMPTIENRIASIGSD